MKSNPLHVSVLLQEVLDAFKGKKITTFFEGTVGAAGHAKAILDEHPEIKKYIACDQDEEALAIAKENLEEKRNVVFVHDNFSSVKEIVKKLKIKSLDGFFVDLGVSSMQLDRPERGFSFLNDGPLDMRMDQSQRLTAEEIVNKASEKELGRIFRELGEEPRWKRAASEIVAYRRKKRIRTTFELLEALGSIMNSRIRGKLHPATLVFQGLRLAVNREIEILEQTLEDAIKLLAPSGRIAVISFHRLEDRVVKEVFRKLAKDKTLDLITKKPLEPSLKEVRNNARSRSAKLRIAEKREEDL